MKAWLAVALTLPLGAAEIHWQHLSTTNAALALPGESKQQTAALVADLDKDGTNDFVLGFRQRAPALVWYRRDATNWSRYVIETNYLTIEAGGAAYDIDGNGDLDLVFGGDWQSKEVWWWENPAPNFDAGVSWERHLIKSGGAGQHHDQVFGDFKGTGRAQLAFWNQGAKKLFLAEIPNDPRHAASWLLTEIFSGTAGEDGTLKYAEGADAFDVDGDGKVDLLAGNYRFKHLERGKFLPTQFAEHGGRVRAGKFKPGQFAQIVVAPGDGSGPVTIYECAGSPTNSSDWHETKLLEHIIHGHTLEIGDIDGDGKLDVFTVEMAKWSEKKSEPDNPGARAWILFGDGQGNFRATVFTTGFGFHEARLADLDGDGDLDLLSKPYTWETPRLDMWLNNGTGRKR
ncbi:MAG TPA: VCBS repeat-containing protein [Candidatus Limnocylindria bacterium]|nr:VCBS repeat-containing protein [Candidatus Limnocylindria bacterium]